MRFFTRFFMKKMNIAEIIKTLFQATYTTSFLFFRIFNKKIA
jgi:hypothetical protein